MSSIHDKIIPRILISSHTGTELLLFVNVSPTNFCSQLSEKDTYFVKFQFVASKDNVCKQNIRLHVQKFI